MYLWIFRGTPIYMQLVFWGLIPTILQNIRLRVPFEASHFKLNLQMLSSTFGLAILGLALNEASLHGRNHPCTESVRCPKASWEASTARRMSWGIKINRTVIPQAMRVIIPPNGNRS